jgi:hypothetical protein
VEKCPRTTGNLCTLNSLPCEVNSHDPAISRALSAPTTVPVRAHFLLNVSDMFGPRQSALGYEHTASGGARLTVRASDFAQGSTPSGAHCCLGADRRTTGSNTTLKEFGGEFLLLSPPWRYGWAVAPDSPWRLILSEGPSRSILIGSERGHLRIGWSGVECSS